MASEGRERREQWEGETHYRSGDWGQGSFSQIELLQSLCERTFSSVENLV